MNLNDLDCSQIMDRINDTANEMQDRVASKILAEYEYKNQHDASAKIDKLSENLKEPLERQIKAVESIADSAKKTANNADVKGWLAIIISSLALFLELFLNRAEIINFISSFFQK